MPNFDGLWELRIYYTVTPVGMLPMEHRFTMDIHVDAPPTIGEAFASIGLLARNNSDVTLGAWTDIVVAAMIPFFDILTNISRAELWFIEEGTFDATFYSSYDIEELGTNANDPRPAGQITYTFRSIGGGTARIQLMETSDSGDSVVVPPYVSPYSNLAAVATAATSCMLARDNTHTFSNIRLSRGQNEKLFKKRYRQ